MSGARRDPASDPAADALTNREAWNAKAPEYAEAGRSAWAGERPPSWGLWRQPESELNVLGDVRGLDVLDYGCGTGYWSAWLTKAGARVTAFDNSPEQLATCRRFQDEFGIAFPIQLGSAGQLDPERFRDASFDLILSEYAGLSWADPYVTVPECARLLRPGGRLSFLKISTLLDVCWPLGAPVAGEELVMDWFDLPPGEWIRLFRDNGLVVESLRELRPPADAAPSRHTFVTLDWARQWPAEELWTVRKA